MNVLSLSGPRGAIECLEHLYVAFDFLTAGVVATAAVLLLCPVKIMVKSFVYIYFLTTTNVPRHCVDAKVSLIPAVFAFCCSKKRDSRENKMPHNRKTIEEDGMYKYLI